MNVRLHCLLAGAAVVSLAAGGLTLRVAQVSGSGTGLRYGPPDKAAMSYVSRCLGAAPPHPIQLYSRGGWYITEDLREQLREREGNSKGSRWSGGSKIFRARSISGTTTANSIATSLHASMLAASHPSESQYTPGDSEPNQRWIYIHTLATAGHEQNLQGSAALPIGRDMRWAVHI